jgi:hypothetical protein
LVSVRNANAGAGGAILSTTMQIANGAGVALLGAIYFTVRATYSDRAAVLVALLVLSLGGLAMAALLRHMGRRWSVHSTHMSGDASAPCYRALSVRSASVTIRLPID